MPAVLNPTLFSVLQARFGKVVVANRGTRASIRHYRKNGRLFADVQGGEYYRVNCPLCGDTHQHLWVSHLFGTYDKKAKSRLIHVALCYRCNATPKSTYLVDMLTPRFGKHILVASNPSRSPPPKLKRVEMPQGQFTLLNELPAVHPARTFLERRGYGCDELSCLYYWMYCEDCAEPYIARRIFVPVLHMVDGTLTMVGYQTRAVPDLSVCERPKYWTMPGFARSQVLYNLHNAEKHNLVVITEGVTDAARVGASAVALLGKGMSREQIRLLLERCGHARVAVLLDSDAWAAGVALTRQLNQAEIDGRRIRGGAFAVRLPSGDPGDYTRRQLAEYIATADTMASHA